MMTRKFIFYLVGILFLVSSALTTIVLLTVKNEIIITFDSDGGSLHGDIKLQKDDVLILPGPTKDGFTFVEWYLLDGEEEKAVHSRDDISKDSKLYARWKTNDYEITFVVNGGSAVLPISYQYNDIPNKPNDPHKDGYLFAGWYDSLNYIDLFEFDKLINDNITLYAKFYVVNNDINYHLDEGVNNNDNPQMFTIEDDNITLYDATKEGYRFNGWYLNDGFSGERITIIKTNQLNNIDLYAKFDVINIDIVYHLDEGVNNNDNPQMFTIEGDTITLHAATKEGFTFNGW